MAPRAFVLILLINGVGCARVAVDRCLNESGWLHAKTPTLDEIRQLVVRLRPLHASTDPPRPGDWRAQFLESGQTFEQYLKGITTYPTSRRRAIYIVPIGELQGPRQQILLSTARYLSAFFCLPVKVGKPIAADSLSWRRHPRWGISQASAEHVLDRVLEPRLPDDATALLGMTTADLYPRRDWNYVYGLAYYHRRVGVFSIYRMGTPIVGHAESQRRVLLRTLKIASHEMGHMLGARHCTQYQCNMGGMNYIGELDRRPMALCPECLAKVLWATDCDPVARYRRLERFCRLHGLMLQARRYGELLRRLTR